jgi:CRISPR-associated protein Csm5
MNATRFLESIGLRLTPLTPVHIGCGVDFEPTNYVIDDGVLYHFDPSRVPLDARARKELLDAINAGPSALRRIQSFYFEQRALFAGRAHLALPVARGVAMQYAERVGRVAQRETGGRDVYNQLGIERTSHHAHSGTAYLPGSSLKGAMRTAWLDTLNKGQGRTDEDRNSTALERRLLDGSFYTDPLRLLLVGDATGADVASKVLFSTNHKKRLVVKDGLEVPGGGPVARRECIVGGQLSALQCELRLAPLPGMHPADKVPKSRVTWSELAAACNRYYLPRLRTLLTLLDTRGFADPGWVTGVRTLVESLAPRFDSGQAMLLRVGRNVGAESVTLDGVREIRIGLGNQRGSRTGTESTTVWLASEHEHAPRGQLLPFGWVLIERDDQPESDALRAWCAAQPRSDLSAIRARLQTARAEAVAEASRLEEDRKARQLAEQQEAARREQAAEEDARRSPEQREIHALAAALRRRVQELRGGKERANAQLHTQVRALARKALAEGWSAQDKAALAAMLTEEVPKAIQLDWKDERKKLQISQLAGSAP